MKKVLLSLIVATGLTGISYGQGIIGPKVGLTISNAKDIKVPEGEEATEYESIVTPQLGIVFNARLGDYVSLRPEILYVQRGFKIESSGSTSTARLNYAEIPFNVVGTFKAGPGKIEVFAGPAAGYMFGGKLKTDAKDFNIKGEDQPTAPDADNVYVNYLNVSLNAGIGYNWKGLIFQAGYNHGFSNLNPHHEDRDSEAESNRKDEFSRLSSVNFALIYLFGGKDE